MPAFRISSMCIITGMNYIGPDEIGVGRSNSPNEIMSLSLISKSLSIYKPDASFSSKLNEPGIAVSSRDHNSPSGSNVMTEETPENVVDQISLDSPLLLFPGSLQVRTLEFLTK